MIAHRQAPTATQPYATVGRQSAQLELARTTLWKTALVVGLLCVWEGFPLAPLGVNITLSWHIFSVFIFGTAILLIFKIFSGRARLQVWDVLPIILFAYCVLASVRYSVFTQPQPLSSWLPLIYTLSPLFMALSFKFLNVKLGDMISGIYWCGFITSFILLLNNASGVELLSLYERFSTFGSDERIVFFKLVSTFSLMIAIMRLVYAASMRAAFQEIFVILVLGYNVLLSSESRLSIAALFLACFLSWLFVMKRKRKVVTAIFAPFIVLPLGFYIVSRFLQNFEGLDQYLENDISATFRRIEIEHFYMDFLDTSGFGFGFMSGNINLNNVLSYAYHFAGYAYGAPGYSLTLDDIGIFAALYQYGYPGLVMVMVMTAMAIWTLVRLSRLGNDYAAPAAVGFLMFSFLLSPIPMNYFTVNYTAHIGGLLWAMASCAAEERQRFMATKRVQQTAAAHTFQPTS